MIEDIKKDATARMKKSADALGHELAKVRTGRAHPSLLDHVMVSYYGSDVPLNQVSKPARRANAHPSEVSGTTKVLAGLPD